MNEKLNKFDRVQFEVMPGGVKFIQKATIIKGPYYDELMDEEVVDLDCDDWEEILIGTPVLGLELA